MTADWEQKLLEIEKGSYDADAFMIEITQMIRKLMWTYVELLRQDCPVSHGLIEHENEVRVLKNILNLTRS